MLKRLNRAMLQTSTVAYTAAAGATLPDSGRIAEKLDALEPQPKACERCDRWLDSVDLLCSLQLAALCASMPVPCPISGCPANCTAMCWELSTLWHYGTFEAYSTAMNACSTAGYWPKVMHILQCAQRTAADPAVRRQGMFCRIQDGAVG